MNKKGIPNVLKYSLIALILFSLLLFSSCKKSEDSQTTEQTEQEQTTDNYFDTVLSGETVDETTEEQQSEEEQATEEDAAQEDIDTSVEDEQEEYEAPTCGDAICTYYETYSSCAEDCEELEETTLFDYPSFLGNGTYIVVGDDASSTDVITAIVISTYLVTKNIEVETILASEVEDFISTDLILIGSPCVNEAIAELLHYDADTCGDVITEQNNAVIKLLVFDTNEILIITGYDEEDTKYASAMLTDESYNLNGAEEWINMDNEGEILLYFSKN